MAISPQGNVIELRVDDVSQLFQTLDPFPFREKDLDQEAEDYIVGWARELPRGRPIGIVIHVPDRTADSKAAREVGPALAHFFSDRAEAAQRDLNELFRVGRRAMLIGIVILVVCLVAARLMIGLFDAR